MKKKITYLILFLLLVIFTFLGFKMGLKPEVFGDASEIIIYCNLWSCSSFKARKESKGGEIV